MDRNSFNAVIKLNDEERRVLAKEIEWFYDDVRDEKIGIIEQEQMIDLFIDNLAPVIYNKALDQVMQWYKSMQDNLESDYYTLYKDIRK